MQHLILKQKQHEPVSTRGALEFSGKLKSSCSTVGFRHVTHGKLGQENQLHSRKCQW